MTDFDAAIQHNAVLNPVLWDRDRLKSPVRGALMRIAEDFYDFIDVPFEVVDVVITGGNANYNYTRNSDIDLHLIADYSSIDCDREAQELFDAKRHLYGRRYNVQIYGIPVELYVEDSRVPAQSAGVYSIRTGQWLRRPSPRVPEYQPQELDHWVRVWQRVLKLAVQTADLSTLRTAVQLLRQYRRQGLATAESEFSIPNLVYKTLRNSGLMQAVFVLIDRLHDQELSIRQ